MLHGPLNVKFIVGAAHCRGTRVFYMYNVQCLSPWTYPHVYKINPLASNVIYTWSAYS